MATQEEIKKAALAKPDQTNAYTNLAGVSQGTKDNLNYYGQGYQQSQTVTDAKNYLQSVIDKKPGEFTSQYDGQIQTLYDQIMGRDKFTYDVNSDPLYQQYKNQYQLLGQQAMQDTVGNAAALTGGHGNSWAATAGSQAYQGYLQQLNDIIPELYSQAYARYAQEGQEMKDALSIAQSMWNMEYGQYRDTVSDWQNERTYAASQYDSEYARDYNNWMQMLSYYQNLAGQENSSYWSAQNNALAQAQLALQQQQYEFDKQMAQDQFEYQKTMDAWEQQFAQDQFAFEKQQYEDSQNNNKNNSNNNNNNNNSNNNNNNNNNNNKTTIAGSILATVAAGLGAVTSVPYYTAGSEEQKEAGSIFDYIEKLNKKK